MTLEGAFKARELPTHEQSDSVAPGPKHNSYLGGPKHRSSARLQENHVVSPWHRRCHNKPT